MAMPKVDYRAIFENTGVASIVIGQDSLILLTNKKFEKLSGCRRDEIEGKKKWTEFVIEDDLSKVKECLWQQEPAADEIRGICEFKFIDPLGNIKYIFAANREIPSTNTAVLSLLDITDRKLAEEALKQRDLDLEMKSRSLEEANVALRVLMKHAQEAKALLEEQVLANFGNIIGPSIEDLKRLRLNDEQISQVELIEKQLQDIASPFIVNLSRAFRNLTPRETQVALLIKQGMSTKEIGTALRIAEPGVNYHRTNLRRKLGIGKTAINMTSYLQSFSS
jgi:PAS domain S-box-containing protein